MNDDIRRQAEQADSIAKTALDLVNEKDEEIAELQAQIEQIRAENEELRKQFAELRERHTEIRKRYSEIKMEQSFLQHLSDTGGSSDKQQSERDDNE